MAASKISKLIEAGHTIEKTKSGFTVNDLLSRLNWGEDAKPYIQNTMGLLTNQGKARKLNNGRPVRYTFDVKNAAGSAPADKALKTNREKPEHPAAAARQAHAKAAMPPAQPDRRASDIRAAERPAQKNSIVSLENVAEMEITLETIGAGVYRRGRELERRIYELEMQLVDTKRNLDDANKRIGELNRVIERQNQVITSGNKLKRPVQPTAKLKEVASTAPQWKRRFTD